MSYLLAKFVKVLNHFSLFFQKTITNSEKFLILNGISIVVVIDSWIKQYVINLTKLVHG